MTEQFDLIVIGGGVIGSASARAALLDNPRLKVLQIEREPQLAMHQSGRNSGVVHVGFNQKPGTIKAKFVVEGSKRLRAYCREHAVPLVEDGIVVVARNEHELSVVEELHRRGTENGAAVEIISQQRLAELEPHAPSQGGLFAPGGASFDARSFVQALSAEVVTMGGQLSCGETALEVEEQSGYVEVRTNRRTLRASAIVNAGGLDADRIAHQMSVGTGFQIVPFRGEYHQLRPERSALVRAHVYAPPDLNFPFLGVHFSKTFDGHVTIGPGAVLAMGRTAYTPARINLRDMKDMFGFPGFWRMFKQKEFRQMAAREWKKSLFKYAVYQEALQLIPEVQYSDLVPYRSGIRAQLVNSDGQMVDDLVVEKTDRSVHVLNAVSPALTCSLPFADYIVSVLQGKLPCLKN